MKRINITQAATAFGVAGLLGFASLASAADQNSGFTDPAKLKKFANVTVVNATAEQRAAGARMKPADGQKAAVDESGQLRQLTAEESAALSLASNQIPAAQSDQPGATETASAPEEVTTSVDGLVGITHDESTLSYAVATVGPDGKVRQACIDDVASAETALKKAAARPGVNNEK